MKILIIGAGPAGLTAAYELLKTGQYDVTVFEETGSIGGLSRTVNYNGNRMDIGGHRFFSKVPEVNAWWERMLPTQGESPEGPDPETMDHVMLVRHRVSRILFQNRFYDYPISLNKETFRNMGLGNTLKCGLSYFIAMLHKLPEDNLENFYVNRFGRRLYRMFFEYYTENLWGRHPRDIDASWGKQRVKGLSVSAVLKDVGGKLLHKENRKVETSLIEEFKYPKFGPGQLWEITASEIEAMGGVIRMETRVTGIHKDRENTVTGLTCVHDGAEEVVSSDIVISSMPLKDLVLCMNDVPDRPNRIAAGLPYRDYMTLGVLVRKLKLQSSAPAGTGDGIVPDCWVYVQDRQVRMGRFQIYNNWSPYLVKDPRGTVWLGLEYFVQEGDALWNMTEEEFTAFAVDEMVRLGIIECAEDVIDSHIEKVKKAYPAYFDTYNEISILTDYLKTIRNLYCVGRNGQHRYNNMDHSMCTSFEAVRNIVSGCSDQDNVWSVNTEAEYHESQEKR